MSESVFGGLCLIVGTSQQVAIRRETTDIEEMVIRELARRNDFADLYMMLSGSRKEGFRLEGSDTDIMVWPTLFKVISEVSLFQFYRTPDTTLFLSDCTKSPPGFTLLQVLTPNKKFLNFEKFVLFPRMNEKFYFSCSVFKKMICLVAPSLITVHGPCAATFHKGIDVDLAFCLPCDFWPSSASSWKDRCKSWPNPEVVNNIIRGGVHFVAIGHPLGRYENIEWRISFSQAEQKCVYAMNHSQFLTYGLLKLFLKEVLNHQVEEQNKLLCSYHMKTAVFWAIQQNTLPFWCPQNLLAGFWVCINSF